MASHSAVEKNLRDQKRALEMLRHEAVFVRFAADARDKPVVDRVVAAIEARISENWWLHRELNRVHGDANV